jgi:hypothetical protein
MRLALTELVVTDGLAGQAGGGHECLGLDAGSRAGEQRCGGRQGSQSSSDVSHWIVSPFEKTMTRADLFQAKEVKKSLNRDNIKVKTKICRNKNKRRIGLDLNLPKMRENPLRIGCAATASGAP